MVRSFFDLVIDGKLSVDDVGLELASDDVARLEAIRTLRAMVGSDLSETERSIELRVRDEYGARLCNVTATISIDTYPDLKRHK